MEKNNTMKTMTLEQLRSELSEAHGDKNNRGWRKNGKPTGGRKTQIREDDGKEVETGNPEVSDDDKPSVRIVTFKTTDQALVDLLQTKFVGITVSTPDNAQTFGPDSFDGIEVNDWSEDDVENDDEPEDDDSDDEELEVKED